MLLAARPEGAAAQPTVVAQAAALLLGEPLEAIEERDAPPEAPRAGAAAARPSAAPVRWRSEADLSASSVGGTPAQALVTGGIGMRREAPGFDTRLVARWTYGEATDQSRETAVTRRSWITAVNVEPKAARAGGAFFAASMERSLEQRFDLRARLEAGVRWAVVRAPAAAPPAGAAPAGRAPGAPAQLDLTVAAVGEHLNASADAPRALRDRATPRWSVRARGKKAVADRVTLDHETVYRPVLLDPHRTTLDTRTRLAVRVADGTDMTLTGQTQLDSEARERGAPANAINQVTFGIALRR